MQYSRHNVALPRGNAGYFKGGEGPPLLYLSGAADVSIMSPLEMVARSHTVYVLIVPDDATPSAGARSMQEIVALAASFVDAVIGQRCDVLGNAAGGDVALWLAILHPDMVRLLVLESPVRSHGHSCGAPELDDGLVGRLGAVATVTLIVRGSRDAIDEDWAMLLKQRIRGSHLVYVYDAGSEIGTDQPHRFDRLVEDFLERGNAFLVNPGQPAAPLTPPVEQ